MSTLNPFTSLFTGFTISATSALPGYPSGTENQGRPIFPVNVGKVKLGMESRRQMTDCIHLRGRAAHRCKKASRLAGPCIGHQVLACPLFNFSTHNFNFLCARLILFNICHILSCLSKGMNCLNFFLTYKLFLQIKIHVKFIHFFMVLSFFRCLIIFFLSKSRSLIRLSESILKHYHLVKL